MTDNEQPDATPARQGGAVGTKGAAMIPLDRAPFTFKTLTAVANTDFVPAALRGKPNSILAAILIGRELGLGPMEALRSIDVIDGRPSPSAEWMVGRVFEAGHTIVVKEQTAESCTVEGTRYRNGDPVATMSFTFTMDMARRVPAKVKGNWKTLADKFNWQSYPEAMLYWRAVSQLIRQFFPDCIRGVRHTVEEMGGSEMPHMEFIEPDYPEPSDERIVDHETGEVLEETEPETVSSEQDEAAVIEDAVVWPPEPTGQMDEQVIEMIKLEGSNGGVEGVWSLVFNVIAEHDSWIGEPMEVIETNTRFICRALEYLEVWESENSLREFLARSNVKHISDLKREQLVQFANNVVMRAMAATRKENT